MVIKPQQLNTFLQQTNAHAFDAPPLCHSAHSHRLFDIINRGKLLAMPCNVFRGENLCYLFVGRPAYKFDAIEHPAEWQLPTVFVIRANEHIASAKRIFPFDSGAFTRKLLPNFITLFKLENYDVSDNTSNVGKLISVFFGDEAAYLKRQAKSSEAVKNEYALSMLHQEVLALSKLYSTDLKEKCDDRGATIEVQVESDISLCRSNLLGVVVPAEYMRVKAVKSALKALCNCVRTYDLYPLSLDQHYAMIYDQVMHIYKRNGLAT